MSRLSGQDLAFLAWESRHRPMHIAAMVIFEIDHGAVMPSLPALQRILDERVRNEPRLQSVLMRRRRPFGSRITYSACRTKPPAVLDRKNESIRF